MNPLQSEKTEVLIGLGATAATNTSNYGYLDTLGWDYAKIIAIQNGTVATNADVFKTIALTEGTNSTAATAIAAFTGGTATSASVGFVIPDGKGSGESTCVVLNVDLRKRERYLRLKLGPGVAKPVTAIAILGRGEAMPGSDDGSAAEIVYG